MKISRIVLWFLFVSSFSFCQTTLNVPQQYSTIQAALNAAQSGDTVLVAPGIYYENILWPNKNGIKLFAAYNLGNTTIDGSLKSSVINFLSWNSIDTTTVIKGFCIKNGGNVQRGAGINANFAYPRLKDLLIENNFCLTNGIGGGIYSNGILLENCTLQGNKARIGGGIYVGSLKYTAFENTIFKENNASFGGALYIEWNNNIHFKNVFMIGNIGTYWGGAISISGSANISNVTFLKNSSALGSSIYAEGGHPKITNNSFVMNKSDSRGTIHVYSSTTATIKNNNFIENLYAVSNENNSLLIDATLNYWGNPFGAQNYYSHTIEGEFVSDFVKTTPYLILADTTAPPFPINKLVLNSVNSTEISLSWNKSPINDIIGYRVYWAYDTINYSLVNSIDVTEDSSCTITNLISGKKYYIAVTCYDNNDTESWFSTSICATTTPPKVIISENHLNFVKTKVGDSSTISIHIIAENSSPLLISSIENSLPFFKADIILPKMVNGFDTLFLDVKFMPTSYGNFIDTMHITTTGGSADIILSGESPHPILLANINSIDFGIVVRSKSSSYALKLTNSSVNVLILDSLSTNTTSFSVSPNCGIIKLGDTLTVKVTFLSSDFGVFNDTLTIFNNSENEIFTIPLIANTPFQVVFNGANLNYGNVAVGDTVVQTISLGNIFNERTVIDAIYTNSSVFQVSPSSITLDPLDTLELKIKFLPSAFMTYRDTVFIMNNALSTKLWISLTGTSPSPNAKTSSSEIVFDSTTLNSSIFSNLKISNTSINCLEIKSIHTKTKVFQVPDVSTIVYRGDTLEIQIEFTPDKEGVFKDTLYIHNNSITGTLKIPLRGISKQLSALCETNLMPTDFSLYQNYPNPFNPSTIIRYALSDESRVRICIYNSLGEMISALFNQVQNAGYYEVEWNGGNRSSGIYFYSINAISESYDFYDTKKMLLIK